MSDKKEEVQQEPVIKFIGEVESLVRQIQLSADQHDYFKDGFALLRGSLPPKEEDTKEQEK